MIRRFPVRLEIVTPGERADALVAEAAVLLGAASLPARAGEVCLSVPGSGSHDAARRAERMLAAQGFGWSAHVRLAAEDAGHTVRHVPLGVPGAGAGTARTAGGVAGSPARFD